MKLHLIAVLVLGTSLAAVINAEECQFCTDGITAEPDAQVPTSGGETCGTLAEYAPTYDAEEYFCTSVALAAEDLCCPIIVLSADDDAEEEEDIDGNTVPKIATIGEIEAQEVMGEDTGGEVPAEMTSMCDVCSGGLTVDGTTIIPYPEADGASCDLMVGYASNVDGSSSTCSEMKEAEAICCPDEPAPIIADNTQPTMDQGGGDDVCIICPGGLTADEDFDIGRGATCGSLKEDALKFDTSSDTCSDMKGAETICCPDEPVPVVDTTDTTQQTVDPEVEGDVCIICPDGLTVDEDLNIGRGATCGSLKEDALEVDISSETCIDMKGAEMICCPDEPATVVDAVETNEPLAPETVVAEVAPCSVCANGLTVKEDTIIPYPEAQGASCTVLLLASNYDENEIECTQMKDAEAICCPDEPADTDTGSTQPVMDPEDANDVCIICPDGLTVDENLDIGQGATCGSLKENALEVDMSSDSCIDMKGAESICCPDGPAEIVTDTTQPTTDPDNNEDDVCILCPDGVTADEDLDIGQGDTCSSLKEDALEEDSSSITCISMKGAEFLCCPTPAENPCSVCSVSGGITVDEGTVVAEGSTQTCGGLMTDALNVEEDNMICESMKGVEDICCPPGTTVAPTTLAPATAEPTLKPTSTPTTGTPTTVSPTETPLLRSPSPTSSMPITPGPSTSTTDASTPSTPEPTPAPFKFELSPIAAVPTTLAMTVSPVGATDENLPVTDPVFEEAEPMPRDSSCLRGQSSGYVVLMITFLVSIVYAMVDL